MNSGIYASYIYPFTSSNQLTLSGLKGFIDNSSACFASVVFFPHGKASRWKLWHFQKHLLINLFILDLHLNTQHQVEVLWCSLLLVFGLRGFVGLCGFCLVFKIHTIISVKNEIYMSSFPV